MPSDEYWINRFGKYKQVTNLETGKSHKVPVLVIVREGLSQQDLHKYPEWTN